MANKEANNQWWPIVVKMEERREDENGDEQQAAVNVRQHKSKELVGHQTNEL